MISNETLILNQTPDEDTFVKINSVLTDETFGKYYTKFRDNSSYDAETLAKFKQLYKQPVSAYVMALGSGNYNESYAVTPTKQKAAMFSTRLFSFKNEVDKPISVTFTLLGLNGEEVIPKVSENSFTAGSTVFDVFKKVLADNNMYYTAKGSYISSINGLAEKDHGSGSGWMYTVGNVFVNSYMNAQELSGGEDIVVMYVTDYSKANQPKNNTDDNSSQNQNVSKPSDNSNNSGSSNIQSDNPASNNNTGTQSSKNSNTNNSRSKSNSKTTGKSTVKTAVKSKSNSTSNSSSSAVKSDNKSDNKGTAADNENTASEDDTNVTDDSGVADGEKTETPAKDNVSNAEKGNNKLPVTLPVIIGSAAGILLLALIILLIIRKKKKQ